MWSHLSQSEIDPDYSDALRRVLGRLGEYAELIIRPLNMRPTGAMLLSVDGERVEVRISAAASSVVLVAGPDADMAGEAFWLRTMAARNLPAPRLIAHDLSGARVPFCYLITSHIAGALLDRQTDEALVRVAARQVGRSLRRIHQAAAPGFGRPTPGGRWTQRSWSAALRAWVASYDARAHSAELLGAEVAAEVWAATIDNPALECVEPRLLHGAVGPGRVMVTTGESVQLEALVRPGPIVAGDPLLDVALALLPGQPAAFRQGFLEGYAAAGPLDPSQRLRLRRLGLIAALVESASDPAGSVDRLLPALVASELRLLREAEPPDSEMAPLDA